MNRKFLNGTLAITLTVVAMTASASANGRFVATDGAELTKRLHRMGLEVLAASQPDSGNLEDLVLVVRPRTAARLDGRDALDDDNRDDADLESRDKCNGRFFQYQSTRSSIGARKSRQTVNFCSMARDVVNKRRESRQLRLSAPEG